MLVILRLFRIFVVDRSKHHCDKSAFRQRLLFYGGIVLYLFVKAVGDLDAVAHKSHLPASHAETDLDLVTVFEKFDGVLRLCCNVALVYCHGKPDIGIERYSSVLLRALEKFDTEEYEALTNIRFVCMDARNVEEVFAPEEVDKIFLNFSDPWPKARHAKRRLTSTEFLERYEKILVQGGRVEFKTDNTELFNFSLEQVKEAGWYLEKYTYDLHHQEEMNAGNIMTEYEEKFSLKGNPINKLIARRKD